MAVERRARSAERRLDADPEAAAREGRDKLAAARVRLLKEKPFFGVLARALELEPSYEVPALRLSPDDRLFYNPMVVLASGLSTLCAHLAHVSLHAALRAHARRRGRDPRRWNVAHDLAIAPLSEAAGLGIDVGPVARAREDAGARALGPGASAEAHYQLLPDGAAPDALACDLCDPLPEDVTVVAPPPARAGGSGLPGPDDEPPSAEGERDLAWKMRLAAALEEERACGGRTFGELPGWIEEMVSASIEPAADGSVLLQQAVSTLGRTGRSWLRPSRRLSALATEAEWPDVVTMPGRRVELAGRLVVVVDTSASILKGTLARFLGTVAAVATAEGVDEVRLVQADAAVVRDETVQTAELLLSPITMVGRGGTDFGPALRMLAAEATRRSERFTVIYFTDLDGRFPAAPEVAPLEIHWVVPERGDRRPPFGRLIALGFSQADTSRDS
jgi:predicted metal-dependent peptidase